MAYNANIQYVHQSGSTQVSYGPPFARPDNAVQWGASSKQSRRFSRVLLWMGCGEVILAVLQCVLCILSLLIAGDKGLEGEGVTQVAPGLWCSVFLTLCGVFGILAGKYPTVVFYGVNIGMCVIAAIFMGILVVLSAVFAIVEDDQTLKGLHIALTVLGFVGFIASIVHSAFTCAGCCCANSTTNRAAAQPVTYTGNYLHPINIPYSNAPGYSGATPLPPQPQHSMSGLTHFNNQKPVDQLPPPPYSP